MDAPQIPPSNLPFNIWGDDNHIEVVWSGFPKSDQFESGLLDHPMPYPTAHQIQTTDMGHNEGHSQLDVPDANFEWNPNFHIPTLNSPQTSVAPMTELTSPTWSSDSVWTPPYGDFGLPSPSAPFGGPSLFPSTPVGVFSQPLMDAPVPPQDFAINTMPQFEPHPTMNPYNTGVVPGVAIHAPVSDIEQSPSEATTARPRAKAIEPPQGFSARSWRNMVHPEKCPECDMTFAYRGGLERHIASFRHREVAARYGVSTKRHACIWCSKTYGRKDHLTRHLVKNHGRPKGRKRRT